MRMGTTGRILKAIEAGGWWTPAEIATKTGDTVQDVDDGLEEIIEIVPCDRRHLGSNKRGDLYAYRLREVQAA